MNKIKILVLLIYLFISACASSSRFSIKDENLFNEPPKIVVNNGKYFLSFQYGDRAFLLRTNSRIQKDNLIFYLTVMTSTGNPSNRKQIEEIIDRKKIDLINKGKVFWEEPENILIPLEIEEIESIENYHYRLKNIH